MKRILSIFVIVLAVFAAVFVARASWSSSPAHADAGGSMTCNGSVFNFALAYVGGGAGFITTPTFNCGDGKTFMWEIQATNDKGFHWYDYDVHTVQTSPSGCNDGCTRTYNNSTPCFTSSTLPNITGYRVHFWWGDGDASWPANGNRIKAADMCNGPPDTVVQQGQ